MNGPKPDKLDSLIRQAFQEEAQKVDVPSSSLLWKNLQQQLENRELRKIEHNEAKESARAEMPYFQAYNDSKNDKKTKSISSPRSSKTERWRKYRYLAGGLTAACLCLAVLFAAFSESSGLRGYFPGFFSANQSMNKMETFESAVEDTLETDESTNDTSIRDRSSSAEPEVPREEQITTLYAENSGEPAEKPADSQPKYYIASENKAPDQEIIATQEKEISDGNENETFVEIAGIEPEEKPEDIYWYEEEEFINSLDNFRGQTSSAILYFADLPDEYSFKVGTVTKTGHFLQKIYHEFENQNGSKLTLCQFFYEEETDAKKAVETAKENGTSYSTQYFTGYLVSSSDGMTTLTWKDGRTVLTLSGQFVEESFLNECLDLIY